ncbi:hypothetical protein BaRGS_00013333 [Batillaria attramentaria]|uniref:Uncharacterized protein n=1 Tax=Batillaria attramentaria TaxID=370345 RepID=A0ABD0L7Q5_9CAEN
MSSVPASVRGFLIYVYSKVSTVDYCQNSPLTRAASRLSHTGHVAQDTGLAKSATERSYLFWTVIAGALETFLLHRVLPLACIGEKARSVCVKVFFPAKCIASNYVSQTVRLLIDLARHCTVPDLLLGRTIVMGNPD